MPPKKRGRPARPATGNRPIRPGTPPSGRAGKAGKAGKASKGSKAGKASKAGTTTGAGAAARSSKAGGKQRAGRPGRREPVAEVVLGSIPPVSRVIGAVGVLGGLLLAVAVLLPYLRVGGEQVVLGDSLPTTVASWIWPVVVIAAGISVALGRYPRFGLAALGVAGVLSLPSLLGELYWSSQAAARGRYEIIAGQRLLTSAVEPLTGWYLAVAGAAVLILAAVAVGWVWPRVVMEDGEGLDPGRPVLGGLAAVAGVAAVLSLTATVVRIPDQVTVTQQAVAGALRSVETLIPVEGAIGLFERPGLALTSGLVLSVVLVLFSVFVTTLRPRLAVVGGLAAFAGYVLALAARGFVDAARSEQIESSVGGWGLLLVGAAFTVLTLLAWRWDPPVRSASRVVPMRPATRRALKKG